MSPVTTAAAPEMTDQARLTKLCTAIRGKLQFMDYLVRAAVADVERHRDEPDQGTRIFIRQLVEMHAANLEREGQNMRLLGELCGLLEALVSEENPGDQPEADDDGGDTYRRGESA
jgi:hypothetical protein